MWKSRNETLCAICDVGSATVSAGLVLFSQDKKPSIVWTTRVPYSIGEKPDIRHLEAVMFELLETAFTQIVSEGLPFIHKQGIREKKVEHLFITLASPWFSAKASSVSIHEDEPFILDEKIISDAVRDEERKFEEEAVRGLYEQVRNQDIRMIEREVVRVLLNGYETKTPYDKYARFAELSLYMSIIPERILSGIQKLAREHLHTDRCTVRTFPLSFFAAVTNLFPHNYDYLLADIAGESTDVSLVKNGTIVETASFGFGRNSLVRALMQELRVDEEIAFSYLHLDASNSASAELRAQIQSVITKHMDSWSLGMKSLLQNLQKRNTIPHACFTLWDEDVSVPFSVALQGVASTCGITHTVQLKSQVLEAHVETRKSATPDIFIAIEALHRHFIFLKEHN